MAERCRAQIAAKRQRDNAIAARNQAGRSGAAPELLAQLDYAVVLASIELMGAVDAVNHGFAAIEAERDGLVLPEVSK
jgi:phage gp29-like protein